MSRITTIDIAGKTYPLNFSVYAAKKIGEHFGGLENVGTALSSGAPEEVLTKVVWLLALLIEQGAAYLRIAEGQDAPTITADDLEVVLGIFDAQNIRANLLKAMTAGAEQTIEVEQPKNAKATQE